MRQTFAQASFGVQSVTTETRTSIIHLPVGREREQVSSVQQRTQEVEERIKVRNKLQNSLTGTTKLIPYVQESRHSSLEFVNIQSGNNMTPCTGTLLYSTVVEYKKEERRDACGR